MMMIICIHIGPYYHQGFIYNNYMHNTQWIRLHIHIHIYIYIYIYIYQ